MCHANAAVPNSGVIETAPNLTDYRGDEVFLRKWLYNPSALRPGTLMPNLNLSDDEISDLIAFINHNQ